MDNLFKVNDRVEMTLDIYNEETKCLEKITFTGTIDDVENDRFDIYWDDDGNEYMQELEPKYHIVYDDEYSDWYDETEIFDNGKIL